VLCALGNCLSSQQEDSRGGVVFSYPVMVAAPFAVFDITVAPTLGQGNSSMEGAQNPLDDDDLNYHHATGRIDRLEVENFKSYRGHQQVGPFKNFTAIIGPNGSGKSNLMDAISFVLGVRTQQLRGSLNELLYSSSAELQQEQAAGRAGAPRRGYVKLVYETDEGEEVHFSRVIQPSSSDPTATYSSVYKINDRVVTWDAYSKRLAGYGILVKVRNFLVFQVCCQTSLSSAQQHGQRCSGMCQNRLAIARQ
jgi:hypothetical protein